MKKVLITLTLILSLSTACFASPNVSAAAAGPMCPPINNSLPKNSTKIQLQKTHTFSDQDSTVLIGTYTKFYSYSFNIPSQGYISLTHSGQKDVNFIICPNPTSQDILINSSSKIGLAPGQYTLNIFNSYIEDYGITNFTINFTQNDSWEIEPNDSFANAQTIATNKTYSGGFSGSYDYFKFNLPIAGRITIVSTTNTTSTYENASSLGLHSYDQTAEIARRKIYEDTNMAAYNTYIQCTENFENSSDDCYAEYQASLLHWSEYYEGVTETFYTYDYFPVGEYSHSSPGLSLPAGTYYLKFRLPTDSSYTLRINYASNSGIVEKASNLNTSSNITLTSLKGTTLSGATISRPEMVQRLMNQGYKKADAIAAVDSLGIDFSYNAVRQALAIRKNNPKQTFNDITYGLLKTTYNFNNFQRRKARTILARWVATGEIK